MQLERPALITFDVFGTLLDWRTGLEQACAAAGHPLGPGDFDRVVDLQGRLEQGSFLSYAEITRESLVEALDLPRDRAGAIGDGVGEWPLYADTAAALLRLLQQVPCAAMTNSDRRHGQAVQRRLGFPLSDWLCAEDVELYKPHAGFWHAMARRRDLPLGRHWWHVSAYADYDLAVAQELGLTTVFVNRPHARPGDADLRVRDLEELAEYGRTQWT